MIVLDLSILNQKGTPMFNSDTFANRPAFGIVGRIFISTDTAAIYRDTGTAWDLIADGGSASTNIYNSNGTLSANRVVSDGGFGLSFTPTTHIGTAAIGGGGSGKLIVGSSTADNGIQIFGANAPSLRIDNAQSGGTQRFVFGLATATNNFIQGATTGEFCISTQSAGNMLFGMWQTINASEVMRITTSNNLLIGSSVDGGQRLQITGSARATRYFLDGMTAGNGALYWTSDRVTLANYNVNGILNFEVNGGVSAATINASGNFGLGVTPNAWGSSFKALQIGTTAAYYNVAGGNFIGNNVFGNSSSTDIYITTAPANVYGMTNLGNHIWATAPSGTAGNPISFTQAMTLTNGGNLLVGTTTDAGDKFQVNGSANISNTIVTSVIRSNQASVASTSSVAATLFTVTGASSYLVYVNVPAGGGDPNNYTAFATVLYDGSAGRVIANNGGALTITLSGANVQATQGSGIPQNINYTFLRIA